MGYNGWAIGYTVLFIYLFIINLMAISFVATDKQDKIMAYIGIGSTIVCSAIFAVYAMLSIRVIDSRGFGKTKRRR